MSPERAENFRRKLAEEVSAARPEFIDPYAESAYRDCAAKIRQLGRGADLRGAAEHLSIAPALPGIAAARPAARLQRLPRPIRSYTTRKFAWMTASHERRSGGIHAPARARVRPVTPAGPDSYAFRRVSFLLVLPRGLLRLLVAAAKTGRAKSGCSFAATSFTPPGIGNFSSCSWARARSITSSARMLARTENPRGAPRLADAEPGRESRHARVFQVLQLLHLIRRRACSRGSVCPRACTR